MTAIRERGSSAGLVTKSLEQAGHNLQHHPQVLLTDNVGLLVLNAMALRAHPLADLAQTHGARFIHDSQRQGGRVDCVAWRSRLRYPSEIRTAAQASRSAV